MVYTISPVHTTEHYLETALRLEGMGADSICIKDMAGLLTPFKAKELVSRFKASLKVPVQLHSHYIGGMALGAYLLAMVCANSSICFWAAFLVSAAVLELFSSSLRRSLCCWRCMSLS